MSTPDIDIDCADRTVLLELLPHRVASISRGNTVERHNTGVYFQPVPTNPLTGLATVDHRRAGELGYFKVDLLNNSVYQGVRDREHLLALQQQEPPWQLFEHAEVVSQLYHINNHTELCAQMRPTSIEQLAQLLAVIRPAKAHLRGRPWSEVARSVWTPPTDGRYHFKRAHAIAFATVIVVQLNLLIESLQHDQEMPSSL